MRTALFSVLGLALVLALTASVRAEDKGKEVKLEGILVCGKCALKETDDCSNVLQVTKDDKTTNYYFKDDGKKEEYHKKICTAWKRRMSRSRAR